MKRFFWIDSTARPGAENMAIDCALLDATIEEGAFHFRIYRWEPHCLSFGRHEPALRRYDRERIAALGVDTVRRPTGGRAVWHATELTYAVAAPGSALGNLRTAYRGIHEVLARALRALGVEATLASDGALVPRPDSGPCFATAVGGEIVVPSGKLLGSAQLRQGGAFLQHGSLLLEGNQEMIRTVSRRPGGRTSETALDVTLGRRVSFDEAATAIKAEVLNWGGPWFPPDTASLLDRAQPHRARFGSSEWTWER